MTDKRFHSGRAVESQGRIGKEGRWIMFRDADNPRGTLHSIAADEWQRLPKIGEARP